MSALDLAVARSDLERLTEAVREYLNGPWPNPDALSRVIETYDEVTRYPRND